MAHNDFNLMDQFGYVLRLVSQRYTAISYEVTSHRPERAEVSALVTLKKGDYTQVDLQALIHADQETAEAISTNLVQRGLVERLSAGDEALLRITEAGRAMAHDYIQASVAVTEKALERLTRYERHVLMEMLKKLI